MKSFITFLTLLLFVSACGGKKEGSTSASIAFKLGALVDMSVMGGNGIKFIGKSDNGDSFIRDVTDQSLKLSLRNGRWSFFVMAWEPTGSTVKFTGKVRCAHYLGVELAGNDVNLDFNLTNANCSNETVYGKSYLYDADGDSLANDYRFLQLKFMPILEDVTVSGFNACTKDSVTGSCQTMEEVLGPALAYQVEIPNYQKDPENPLAPQLVTDHAVCSEPSTSNLNYALMGGNSQTTNLNIPSKMPIRLRVDYEGSCGALNTESEVIIFENGFLAHATDFIHYEDAATTEYALYHRNSASIVCGGTRGTRNNLFGGRASGPQQPKAICNPNQFSSIGLTEALNTSYVLLQNIDLEQTDSQLLCSGNLFPMTNFKPIGAEFDINSNCDFTEVTPTSDFTGRFDGLGHTISNARIERDSESYVGLFRRLGSNAVVRNLKIAGAEVRSEADDIGILAGKSYGSSGNEASIENVTILDGDVESRGDGMTFFSYTGGLLGYSSYTNIKNVILARVKIRGSQYVGGMVGAIGDGTTITQSGFLGNVEGEGINVGGIAGSINSASDISLIQQSFAIGAVSSRGQYLGGIVGNMGGPVSIVNSYSKVMLMSREHYDPYENSSIGLHMGGIAGYATAVTQSIALGGLQHNCFDSNTSDSSTCKIGDAIGATAGTIANVFALDNLDESTTGGASVAGDDVTLSNLFSTSYYTTNLSAFDADWVASATPIWKKPINGLPHLSWETMELNPCIDSVNLSAVSAQILAGRGTATNPIGLCTYTQVNDMRNTASLKHFKLLAPIVMGNMSLATNSFGGVLQGDGHALVGGKITVTGNTNFGFFKELASGSIISDVSFVNISIEDSILSSVDNNNIGIIAGTNNGTIKDTRIFDSHIIGLDKVGLFVGTNNGEIINAEAQGYIQGKMNLGSIAGINSSTGEISKASSWARIENRYEYSGFQVLNGSNNVGGIAGQNIGKIGESRYGGEIVLSVTGSSLVSNVGGIAGLNGSNSTATISNCLVGDSYGSYIRETIRLEIDNILGFSASSSIGGLVGKNNHNAADVIKNSIMIGRVVLETQHSGSIPSVDTTYKVGPIVGDSINNDTALSRTHFLQDSVHHVATQDIANYSCDTTNERISYTSSNGYDYSAYNLIKVMDSNYYIRDEIWMDTTTNSYSGSVTTFQAISGIDLGGSVSCPTTTAPADTISLVKTIGVGNMYGSENSDTQLMTIETFCDDLTGTDVITPPLDPLNGGDRNFSCANGFDMVQDFSGAFIGSGRLYDYHMGIYNAYGRPVWSIEEGMRYPSLFDMH